MRYVLIVLCTTLLLACTGGAGGGGSEEDAHRVRRGDNCAVNEGTPQEITVGMECLRHFNPVFEPPHCGTILATDCSTDPEEVQFGDWTADPIWVSEGVIECPIPQGFVCMDGSIPNP